MAGHIKQDKKTKKWLFTIEAGKDAKGNRKRRIRKGFKNKTEAKNAMAIAIAEFQKEEVHSEDKQETITVGDFLDYWLKSYAETNTVHNTFKAYERIIRVHLKPALGNIKINELKVRDVQQYYSKKVRTENTVENNEGEGRLSKQTVLHHHRVLNKALNDALDWEFVDKNVAKRAKPPRPDKAKFTTYTPEELNLLLKSASGSVLYFPIITAAAHTGARVGELRALTWGDIDFNNRKIFITKSAYDKKGEGVKIKNAPKNGQNRAISMGKRLVELFQRHKDNYEKKKALLGPTFNPNDLVFYNTKGNYLDVRDLARAYKRAVKEVHLSDSRFHDLRHSHATILLQQNVHPKVVSERLGHTKVSITLDLYSHVNPLLQDSAAKAFDDAF
ncbi:tyrosine-type recombinase/integrase [Bacillus alkalicellulosilyticus]|uniref:tyrosine-type recombinase/integrase n=1 Tax=Alkalihalobacterium alkalicellulosilyticum TaxID=1912214 RepID=UPI00099821E8|nr:tyrosine-type recombinase/integrase [Bacillus alkalicellulosilyticus]